MTTTKATTSQATRTAPADDYAALAERLAATEARLGELQRRATFPEQNPNLVIELDREGCVTYINPVAQADVPDLVALGPNHPMLHDFGAIVAAFEAGEVEPIIREVEVGDVVFEQKLCPTHAGGELVVRLFAHDVTARKRAEKAIQQLARRVVTAQEEERHRVSRELHDEAGQALTALKISLQLILADLPPEASGVAADLADAVALVDTTRERIRALAHGLRPPALDAIGLNLTLEDACRTYAGRTGLDIHYDGDAAREPLPDAVSICFYRLLQEALANAARHAQATRVTVTLRRTPDLLSLVVVDDGMGFDMARHAAAPGRSMGLRGMAERLDLLGGTLTVQSAPGRGTRLEARAPVSPER